MAAVFLIQQMESTMNETLVYLSITKGKNRLVIDGSFDLFKDFVTTFTQGEGGTMAGPASTVYNPAPQMGDTDTRR